MAQALGRLQAARCPVPRPALGRVPQLKQTITPINKGIQSWSGDLHRAPPPAACAHQVMHCCLAQAAGRHALCSQSCSVCFLGHALLPGQGSARYVPRTPSRSMCSLGHCCLAEFVRASGQDKHSWHPLQGRTSASAGHNVLSLKQQSLVKQDTLSYYLGT